MLEAAQAHEVEQMEIGRAVAFRNEIVEIGIRIPPHRLRIPVMVFRILERVRNAGTQVQSTQRSFLLDDILSEPLPAEDLAERLGSRLLP